MLNIRFQIIYFKFERVFHLLNL